MSVGRSLPCKPDRRRQTIGTQRFVSSKSVTSCTLYGTMTTRQAGYLAPSNNKRDQYHIPCVSKVEPYRSSPHRPTTVGTIGDASTEGDILGVRAYASGRARSHPTAGRTKRNRPTSRAEQVTRRVTLSRLSWLRNPDAQHETACPVGLVKVNKVGRNVAYWTVSTIMKRQLKTRLHLIKPDVGRNVITMQSRQKTTNDRHAKVRIFKIGDLL